ncbi:hypothetical protein HYU18_02655, partial [Candidatus Woesearchaeota archaeon]|nr:hypothetical protein [Candidatus Woesearchaeota archaeon]
MAEAEGDFYAAYDDYIDDDEISPEEAGFMAGYEGMDKEEAEDSDNDLGP